MGHNWFRILEELVETGEAARLEESAARLDRLIQLPLADRWSLLLRRDGQLQQLVEADYTLFIRSLGVNVEILRSGPDGLLTTDGKDPAEQTEQTEPGEKGAGSVGTVLSLPTPRETGRSDVLPLNEDETEEDLEAGAPVRPSSDDMPTPRPVLVHLPEPPPRSPGWGRWLRPMGVVLLLILVLGSAGKLLWIADQRARSLEGQIAEMAHQATNRQAALTDRLRRRDIRQNVCLAQLAQDAVAHRSLARLRQSVLSGEPYPDALSAPDLTARLAPDEKALLSAMAETGLPTWRQLNESFARLHAERSHQPLSVQGLFSSFGDLFGFASSTPAGGAPGTLERLQAYGEAARHLDAGRLGAAIDIVAAADKSPPARAWLQKARHGAKVRSVLNSLDRRTGLNRLESGPSSPPSCNFSTSL